MNLQTAGLLALFWGLLWALILQKTWIGRWLALYRTYWTVIIGVGGDLLILYFVIPFDYWFAVCAVVAASSAGQIGRALWNEHRGDRAL